MGNRDGHDVVQTSNDVALDSLDDATGKGDIRNICRVLNLLREQLSGQGPRKSWPADTVKRLWGSVLGTMKLASHPEVKLNKSHMHVLVLCLYILGGLVLLCELFPPASAAFLLGVRSGRACLVLGTPGLIQGRKHCSRLPLSVIFASESTFGRVAGVCISRERPIRCQMWANCQFDRGGSTPR